MSGRSLLVGRAGELGRVTAALAASEPAAGRVVMVGGEPGVGKSALVRAVAAEAEAAGVRVLWGECYEGAGQSPFGPWDAVFAGLGIGAGSGRVGLASADARLALFSEVHAGLAAARSDGPVLVVVDDLHWASPDSLELFVFVAARTEAAGIALVGVYRDPDPALEQPPFAAALGSVARLPATTDVHLAGLDADAVAAYLGERLGAGVPQAVARAVHAHTSGNPFFVREVAAALVSDGTLVQRNGRWLTDVSVPAFGIPPTVRHVVRARTEGLSPAARALLQAGSVFPEGFELATAAAIADLDETAALDAVDEAFVAGFLRRSEPPAPPYAFAHAIVRHALADAQSPDRAARLHRRAAEALSALRPANPAAVVQQWWRSRSVAGAEAGVAVGLAAASAASARHAHREAAGLLRLTLDLVAPDDVATQAEVLSRLAVEAARSLDAEAAAEATNRATALLEPGAAGDLAVEVADALREGAPPTSWIPLVTAAIGGLGAQRDLTWARLVTSLDPVETVAVGSLRVGRWTGYPPEATALLEAAPGETDQARAIEPFRPRTVAETERLRALADAWSSPAARMRALDLAGRDHSLRHGRPLDAIACYRGLLAIGERVGSVAAQAEACAQLGLCLGLVGDLDDAAAFIDRAHALVGDLWPGHRLHLLGTVSSRVIVGYATGDADWDSLADSLRAWIGRDLASRAPWTVVFAALVGLIDAMAGRDARAAEMLADVAGVLARVEPEDHAVAGSLWFSAAAAWEMGDAGLAGRLAALVDRHHEAAGPPGPIGSLALAKARITALVDGPGAAAPWWDVARADAERSGCRPVRLLADVDEARAEGRAVAVFGPALAAAGLHGWAARVGAPAGRLPAPAGLSRRECEVLGLVAAGRTNKEIAADLVLSLLTVNRHVANVYAKIGARNRAEATAFAIANGLANSV